MLNRTNGGDASRLWDSRWFLPGTLGVAALAEFLLNRLGQPLASALRGGGPTAWPLLSALSRFSLNLASVLGVIVVGGLLLRATQPGGAASRPLGRLSILSLGSLLLLLGTFMILAPDGLAGVIETKRSQWLVELSAVCVSVLGVLGVLAPSRLPPPYPWRFKLALLFLLMPPLLLLETQWGLLTSIRLLQRYGLLTLIYGPVLAVIALGGGALLLSERPPRPLASLPILGAVVVTATMGLCLHRLPNLTARLIYMSFDLRLPPHAEAYALYLLSLCAWVFAVIALALGRSAQRARSLGLLLIGLGGCQSRTLHQMLYYLSGLLCICESLLMPTELPLRAAPRRHHHDG